MALLKKISICSHHKNIIRLYLIKFVSLKNPCMVLNRHLGSGIKNSFLFLVSLGFLQSKHGYTLFTKFLDGQFLALLFYVDKILLVGASLDSIAPTKAALDQKFIIKDFGVAKYFLGIQLCHHPIGLYLNQEKYITNLLLDSSV